MLYTRTATETAPSSPPRLCTNYYCGSRPGSSARRAYDHDRDHDQDDDDAISFAEIVQWFGVFDARKAFEAYDADRSGEISTEELKGLLDSMVRECANA